VEAGILVSYFAKHSEGQRAIRLLGRQGFRRTALVHRTTNGDVQVHDPFLLRRSLWVMFATVLFGGVAGVASLVLDWPAPMLSGIPFPLISILVGGFCGAVLTVAWTRRSKNGVDRKLIDDYGRWLVSEESVVILQAPIEMLQTPMALLRQGFEISPPMFVQHPEREHFGEDIRAAGVLSLFKTLSGFRIPS